MSNERKISVDLSVGPCEDILKSYPSGHFQFCISDPPYGLGDEPDIYELFEAWVNDEEYDMGKGFMDQIWDSVPPPSTFEEIYRVLEPGGTGVFFAGTRTMDLMIASLKLAGFEFEKVLRWTQGGGFPKSFNVRKHTVKKIDRDDRYLDQKDDESNDEFIDRVTCDCVEEDKEYEFINQGSIDPQKEIDRRVITDDYGDHDLVTRVCSWCLKPDPRFMQFIKGKGTSLKPSFEPCIVVSKPDTPKEVDVRAILEEYDFSEDEIDRMLEGDNDV